MAALENQMQSMLPSADEDTRSTEEYLQHPLETVPFFQRPIGSSTKDLKIGEDDAGNPVFQTSMGNEYTVKLNPDQRTLRKKVSDAIPVVKEAVTDYIEDPKLPTKEQLSEFAKQAGQSAVESVEDLGDLMFKGEGTTGDVFGAALGAGTASIPFSVPEGAVRVFGGAGAKKIDTNIFSKAEKLWNKGTPNEEIREQTGWYKDDADRKWRFEIDDSQMKLAGEGEFDWSDPDAITYSEDIMSKAIDGGNYSSTVTLRLGDFLEHKKLFKHYPQLKDYKVILNDTSLGLQTLGSFSPQRKRFSISPQVMQDPEYVKEILIHEIQHGIQEIEGFLPGSNVVESAYLAAKKYTDEADKISKTLESFGFNMNDIYLQHVETLEDQFKNLPLTEDQKYSATKYFARLTDLDNKVQEVGQNEYKYYKNRSGEVEANLASGRRTLTPVQRANLSPIQGKQNTITDKTAYSAVDPTIKRRQGQSDILLDDVDFEYSPSTKNPRLDNFKYKGKEGDYEEMYSARIKDFLKSDSSTRRLSTLKPGSTIKLGPDNQEYIFVRFSRDSLDKSRLNKNYPHVFHEEMGSEEFPIMATAELIRVPFFKKERTQLIKYVQDMYNPDKKVSFPFKVKSFSLADLMFDSNKGKAKPENTGGFRDSAEENKNFLGLFNKKKSSLGDQAQTARENPKDYGYRTDNPATKGYDDGEEWLKNKQKAAEDRAKKSSGENATSKLLSGAITGYMGQDFKRPLFLNTEMLSKLKGANNEKRYVGESRYDLLRKRVDERGFDPEQKYDSKDDYGNAIIVGVNHKGEAFIVEGNTRVAVAKDLNVPSIRAEVKYYNGAEEVDGPYSPQNIIQYAEKPKDFNKGGTVMNKQMEMAFMQEGGLKDDGMNQDPVSGNEVPSGSMASEVRDDIPAQLSEGEYVVPADVVRYFGVKHFEDLRNKAKGGLNKMEADGRIGGEPVPVGGPKAGLRPDEMQEIQKMFEGGMVSGAAEGADFSFYNPEGSTTEEAVTTPTRYSGEFSFEQPGAGGPSPVVTTPETSEQQTVTLYGPNGEVIALMLPRDQTMYDQLIAQGYGLTAPQIEKEKSSKDDDKVQADPNAWMDKYDYNNLDNLASQTENLLTAEKGFIGKILGGGVIGMFTSASNAAQAAANIAILKANGQEAEAERLKTLWDDYVKQNNIDILPSFTYNGDQLTKQIVQNNPGKDLGLQFGDTDVNGDPIFKDQKDFDNFAQSVAPEGMTFIKGEYIRPEGVSAAPEESPRPKARPASYQPPKPEVSDSSALQTGPETRGRKRPKQNQKTEDPFKQIKEIKEAGKKTRESFETFKNKDPDDSPIISESLADKQAKQKAMKRTEETIKAMEKGVKRGFKKGGLMKKK